ncbi:hypothetical protein [Pelagibacterium lentulum]|uniref:Uncharacterized protein n=1 Tax=Pelagibacterium lentulum TaxID=2029865 RepID=A0A916W3Y9_9HYPH|nr:hypothetical protein [Pelagibacterium lentulum]GGA63898.1 hypothetical protein GCM10011499_37880 [Pelagibacterium lentulum]
MADQANITRRAVLSGVAALPFTPLAAMAEATETTASAPDSLMALIETYRAVYGDWERACALVDPERPFVAPGQATPEYVAAMRAGWDASRVGEELLTAIREMPQ